MKTGSKISRILGLAIMLALMSLCTFCASALSSEIYSYSYFFNYEVVSEKKKTCTITDWEEVSGVLETPKDFKYVGEVVIPQKIDGYTVVALGEEAFSDGYIKSVEIPGTVKKIGDSCFYGQSITKVKIGNGVTEIGKEAFFDTNIETIVIPDSVTKIDDKAFMFCERLSEVTLPSKIKTFGSYVFNACKSLKNIVLPENLTTIPSSTFSGCKALERVVIPASVKTIESFAFDDCSALASISIPSSVTRIGQYAFTNSGLKETLVIPGTVKKIDDNAFARCNGLTNVILEEGVETLGKEVFSWCKNLKYLSLPDSFKKSGSDILYYSDKATIHGATDYFWIAEEHTFQKNVVEPSCAEGYTVFTCECGYSYKGDYKPAVKSAHTIKKVKATKATLKTDGKTTGSYCTVCSAVFEESKKIPKIKSVELSATQLTYNGKNRKPKVTVKNSEGKVISSSNYKVTYPKKTKSIGTYTVKIVFSGKYSGTVKKTFKILPKGSTITKLTRIQNGVTVKWKKQANKTAGYQIQYSLKKDFSKAKTITIKKNTTIETSVKKLTAGKNYYIRVRTYAEVKSSGKTVKYYSKWSDSVKILVVKQSAKIVPQTSKAATLGMGSTNKYYQSGEVNRATLYTEVKNKYKGFYPYKMYIYMSDSQNGKYKCVAEETKLGVETEGVHYGWSYINNLKPNKAYYFKMTVIYVPTSCLNSDLYKKLTPEQKIYDNSAPIVKFWTAPEPYVKLETTGNVLKWKAYKGAVGYYVTESTNSFQGYNIYGQRVYASLDAKYVVKTNSATSYKVKNNMTGELTRYTVYPIVKRGEYYYCGAMDITKSMSVEPKWDVSLYAS